MLNLIRLAAGRSTSRQSISQLRLRSSHQLGSARHVSDTGLGGFGALSVPIPLKSQDGIPPGKSKNKQAQGQEGGQKHDSSTGKRARGRASSAVIRIKQRENKAKQAAEAMNRSKVLRTEASKEKERVTALNKPVKAAKGAKSRIRGRRGKGKPQQHTQGVNKEGKASAGQVNQEPTKALKEDILDSAFGPSEFEGMFR